MHPFHPWLAATIPFLVWGVIGIPLSIGNAFIARRLGKSVVLWVVLSIVPLVNLVFFYYVAFRVVYTVLDRLAGIADEMKRLAAR